MSLRIRQLTALLACSLLLILEAACGNRHKSAIDDTTRVSTPADTVAEEYHADNDIAMVVRSVVDAVRVGEHLQGADYDCTGILTDGSGKPLYTDTQGKPGTWKVSVESPSEVRMVNLQLGDLMAEDLAAYLLATLYLDDSNLVKSDVREGVGRVIYDFDGGFLSLDIRNEPVGNDQYGARMTISVSRDRPKS